MRPQKLNCTADFLLNHMFNYIVFEKCEASKTSKIFGRYGAAVNSNFSNIQLQYIEWDAPKDIFFLQLNGTTYSHSKACSLHSL